MKVTVLMPVYNAGIFLKASIESILTQSYKDFEFLIINDGSSDGSEEIIRSYDDSRIRVYTNEKNLGLIASLNKGLALAKGEYIVRQDADDISMSNRLKVQVEYMDKNPDLLLLSTNAIIIDNQSNVLGESDLTDSEIGLRFRMLFKCGIFHTSTIFRQKTLEEFDLQYDPAYPHAEDYKLWSEISRQGNVQVLKDKLVKYRNHPESISSKNKKQQEEVAAKVVKENIENIGVEVTLKEAERLRGLFRTTGINRKFLQYDIKLLVEIVKSFEKKYSHQNNYDPYELLTLLKRMVGWISKKDLLNINYLLLYIHLKGLIFIKDPLGLIKKSSFSIQ